MQPIDPGHALPPRARRTSLHPLRARRPYPCTDNPPTARSTARRGRRPPQSRGEARRPRRDADAPPFGLHSPLLRDAPISALIPPSVGNAPPRGDAPSSVCGERPPAASRSRLPFFSLRLREPFERGRLSPFRPRARPPRVLVALPPLCPGRRHGANGPLPVRPTRGRRRVRFRHVSIVRHGAPSGSGPARSPLASRPLPSRHGRIPDRRRTVAIASTDHRPSGRSAGQRLCGNDFPGGPSSSHRDAPSPRGARQTPSVAAPLSVH